MSEIKIPSQLSRQSATLESGILTCKLELSKRNSDTYKLILKKFKKIINNKNSEWEKKKNLTFSFLLTLTSHDTQFTSKLIFLLPFQHVPTLTFHDFLLPFQHALTRMFRMLIAFFVPPSFMNYRRGVKLVKLK